jgi:hypothetical protein
MLHTQMVIVITFFLRWMMYVEDSFHFSRVFVFQITLDIFLILLRRADSTSFFSSVLCF